MYQIAPDGSLYYARQSYQLKIYHSSKSHISSFHKDPNFRCGDISKIERGFFFGQHCNWSGSQKKTRGKHSEGVPAYILTHGWRGRDTIFSELILPCFYAKRSRSPAPRWWWCHGLGKLIVLGIIFRKATNWTWQRKTVVSSKNLKYVRFSNKNSLEEFTINWKFTIQIICVDRNSRTET